MLQMRDIWFEIGGNWKKKEKRKEKRPGINNIKWPLQKCYKQTQKWRMTEIDKTNRHKKRWIVMKELFSGRAKVRGTDSAVFFKLKKIN